MRGIGSLRALIPSALMVLFSFGAVEAQAWNRIPPELADRAAREGAVRVIVQLEVPTLPEGRLSSPRSRLLQRQRIDAAQDGLREELAGTAHRTSPALSQHRLHRARGGARGTVAAGAE